ncbi:MAG: flagellar basal-body rod protein FlgG [Phycisphaerales bacterium]|nr:flagellar basal-body rod protein FlgG [Phycisphaerales bacterium]
MAIIALQSAASGLTALNTAMDVISNNLANVNTAGFRASRANFQDLLYLEKAQPGVRNANDDQRPTGLYIGLGTRVSGTQLSFEQGSPIKGNKLDMMIEGNGFFRVAVQDSLGPGGIAYTRAGQFTLNSDGEIVLATDQGRRLDPPVTIDGDVTDIQIDSSGQIFVERPGQAEPELVTQIQISNFVNPTGLKSLGENLFAETGASGPPIDGNPSEDAFGEIIQGYYESSNVDPTTELINLIRVQRAFEMNSNTIRAADESLRTIAQLRR